MSFWDALKSVTNLVCAAICCGWPPAPMPTNQRMTGWPSGPTAPMGAGVMSGVGSSVALAAGAVDGAVDDAGAVLGAVVGAGVAVLPVHAATMSTAVPTSVASFRGPDLVRDIAFDSSSVRSPVISCLG